MEKNTLRAVLLGLLSSFFFAFTFLLNRSMELVGGYWGWSAALRYLFTLPILTLLLLPGGKLPAVFSSIRSAPGAWFLWSTVGFGLFYAPLTFAASFGESWFVAACWQITIVAGTLLTPLWGKPIPLRQMLWAGVILLGVFLLQFRPGQLAEGTLLALGAILAAAFSYPLGNRKTMALSTQTGLGTIQRIFGMTICSLPFWLLLSGWSLLYYGVPSAGQVQQSLLVALFSGIAATILFFRATQMVREDPAALALVEATQAGEVLFTLLLGVLCLEDALPGPMGWLGITLIVTGMICSSLSTGKAASRGGR